MTEQDMKDLWQQFVARIRTVKLSRELKQFYVLSSYMCSC